MRRPRAPYVDCLQTAGHRASLDRLLTQVSCHRQRCVAVFVHNEYPQSVAVQYNRRLVHGRSVWGET